MAGIAITRRELTAAELRRAAGKTQDAKASRRIREPPGDGFPAVVQRTKAEGLAGLVNRAQEPVGAATPPAAGT